MRSRAKRHRLRGLRTRYEYLGHKTIATNCGRAGGSNQKGWQSAVLLNYPQWWELKQPQNQYAREGTDYGVYNPRLNTQAAIDEAAGSKEVRK